MCVDMHMQVCIRVCLSGHACVTVYGRARVCVCVCVCVCEQNCATIKIHLQNIPRMKKEYGDDEMFKVLEVLF